MAEECWKEGSGGCACGEPSTSTCSSVFCEERGFADERQKERRAPAPRARTSASPKRKARGGKGSSAKKRRRQDDEEEEESDEESSDDSDDDGNEEEGEEEDEAGESSALSEEEGEAVVGRGGRRGAKVRFFRHVCGKEELSFVVATY